MVAPLSIKLDDLLVAPGLQLHRLSSQPFRIARPHLSSIRALERTRARVTHEARLVKLLGASRTSRAAPPACTLFRQCRQRPGYPACLQPCTVDAMAAESKKAVVAAIVGNAAIAAIKFVAGALTGSSAMISEGIHSVVDTGNGGLLFHGLRRGARPADTTHPFGHGMEVFFWSLIVAVSIFGIGGGMSIYEGIVHIQDPSPLENPLINYIVLGCRHGVRAALVQRGLEGLPQSTEGYEADPDGHPSRQGPQPVHGPLRGHGGACSVSWSPSWASSSATCSTNRSSTASPRWSSVSSWSARPVGSPTRAGACWSARPPTPLWWRRSARSPWPTRR